MALNQVTPPTIYPVTYQELKDHCRLTQDLEQSILEDRLIPVSTAYAEKITERALITQTWKYSLKCFPCCLKRWIVLPKPPVQNLIAFEYINQAGVVVPLVGNTDYYLAKEGAPALLAPISSWPGDVSAEHPYPVSITFNCGYGPLAHHVPIEIRQAILIFAAHLFSNREEVIVSATGAIPADLQIALGADALLKHHTVFQWDAQQQG